MSQEKVSSRPQKIEAASQHVAGAKQFGGRRNRLAAAVTKTNVKPSGGLSERLKTSGDFGTIFVSTVGGAAIGSVAGPVGVVIGGAIGGVISAVSEGVISFGRKR
ncbi:hypothetical protein SAMN05444172_2626 [Burkholderia sp. GAS332]|nr:hypothetical protein SAMN05444172_2626 [Burkholderia sp. GAS332]